jgi:hypothetical protein
VTGIIIGDSPGGLCTCFGIWRWLDSATMVYTVL